MLNILSQLEAAFPQLSVHYHEILSKELRNYWRDSSACVAIIVENGPKNEFHDFLNEYALEAVKIADDEVVAFVSRHSPYAKLDCLKQEHYSGINFIALRDFENVNSSAALRETNTYSQNVMLNQHFILNQSAVHFLPRRLGKAMFAHPDIISVPIEPPSSVTYYLLYQKEIISGEFQAAVVFLIDVLRQILA